MNPIGSNSLKTLVLADKVMDYVPILSTGTNLINLFQKIVMIPRVNAETVSSNDYYRYLKEKSIERCILLLIPGIGNLLVIASDNFRHLFRNKEFITNYPSLYSLASSEVLEDRDVFFEIVKKCPYALCTPNTPFQDDEEIVLAAVTRNGLVIKAASNRLKNEEKIGWEAVSNEPSAVIYLSSRLKAKKDIGLLAVSKKGNLLADLDDSLKRNRDVVLQAVTSDGSSLKHASNALKNDRKIVSKAIETCPLAIFAASERLQNDPTIIQKLKAV